MKRSDIRTFIRREESRGISEITQFIQPTTTFERRFRSVLRAVFTTSVGV